ncbi:MAG: DUF2586 domain-containing protein [Deltaproteobacteria bacterium HGW-Deltaproteobacteria-15]|jgi:hypothetical protein|nr:MAG: DUF2586 domain-containing protein [Deltaproteobacteria bacterium HGW-Deltaproteobacteria-15]
MGDVLEYLVDGVSGLAPGGVEGVCMVTGVCSLGTPGQPYLLGKSSNLETILGVGPLCDRLRDLFAAGGQNPIVIAVPVAASTAGVIGAIAHTGEGAEVTADGTVLAAAQVVMTVILGGERNEATYTLSVDGGDSTGPVRTVPVDGLIAVGSTGVVITVPEEPDLAAGDVYVFDVSEPAPSITDVMTAIEQPLSIYDVEMVYVVGASDATDWAAMGAKADTLWNAHRPAFFLAETRMQEDGETLDEWVTAMLGEAAGASHRFVAVCAAFGEVSDQTGKRLTRNFAGLAAGRIVSMPVMRAMGRVRDGGISQAALPGLFTETMQQQLESSGLITARRYAGLDAAYWGDARTLADDTSDYRYIETVRTVFKAVRKARIAALKSMYDEAGDPMLEAAATGLSYLKANIENALNTMRAAVPKELADFIVTIPQGQDIVNNGVAVEMQLIGIPIIRQIKLYASYIYAGSQFDPRLQ